MIVGVAIKNDSVVIKLPKPSRHCACFRYATEIGIDTIKEKLGSAADNQGFYTHTGRYLNRKQAAKYVKRIKQPVTGAYPKSILFSEDLW